MRNIWVISDTHHGHANIIKYCNRPFSDPFEMDEAILSNWNETVNDGDIVYHLGDVYFGKKLGYRRQDPETFLKQLKGRKRLVLGNHDDLNDGVLTNVFQKVVVWRKFPEFGKLLTHVPVHQSTLENSANINKALVNLHGHIHEKPSPKGPYVNVSVEWTKYKPVNIEEIK